MIRGDFYTQSSDSKPANDILITLFKKAKIDSAVICELEESPTVEGMVEIMRNHNKLDIFNSVGTSKGFKVWQKKL